ncbi:MAG: hypothetical protein NXI22_01265 [bacterium]|nr:hypothetical protein [bacterium]
MCDASVVKELPETSKWHGAVSEEDVALVRSRHAEKVEEWLDFADFANELFKLHEKYGIDKGEEGYFAYRKHLRTNYNQKLETYGLTPDPLDEGCECIFCSMHAEESPAETETEVHSTASGKCEHPEAMLEKQGTHIPRSLAMNQEHPERRLGQVPAESSIDVDSQRDQTPVPKSTTNAITKPGSKKLGPVPAYDKSNQPCEMVEDSTASKKSPHVPRRPHALIQSGKRTRLKKMSGAVF